MRRRTPISTRTDTLIPYTTLVRSHAVIADHDHGVWRCFDDAPEMLLVERCRKRRDAAVTGDDGTRRVLADCGLRLGCHSGGIGMSASSRKRSEENTSALQSIMRNSYAVFSLKQKTKCITEQH